jgi:hypothetical protein
MSYFEMSRKFICCVAMPLALMFAACSDDKSVAGGSAEETGVTANSQYYSIKGRAQQLNQLVGQVVEQANGLSNVNFDYHNLAVRMSELDSVTLDSTGVVFYGTSMTPQERSPLTVFR